MLRFRVVGVLWSAVLVAMALGPLDVFATPAINSAVIRLNVARSCASLSLVAVNDFPTSITIADTCIGRNPGNIHLWRLSEDGTNEAVFNNADGFRFCADLRVSGGLFGAFGLQLSPWWSQVTPGGYRLGILGIDNSGFVSALTGRLPPFAFTRPEDLLYTGGWIHLEMIYLPHDLSPENPATMEYRVTYNNRNYTSGPLPFTEGDPADDPPYGRWGILNDARVGGYMETDTTYQGLKTHRVEWSNICFESLTVDVAPSTWTRTKVLYR